MKNKYGNEVFVVGLKGPKTVGKTTYSKHLVHKYTFTQYSNYYASVESFASPIKDFLDSNKIFIFTGLPLRGILKLIRLKYSYPKHADKEVRRKYYQKAGDICRGYNKNHFVNLMKKTISNSLDDVIIIDDVRYLSEAEICNELNILSRDGVEYTSEHSSEERFSDLELEILKLNNCKIRYHKLKNEQRN